MLGHSIAIVAFEPALGWFHPFSSSLACNLEPLLQNGVTASANAKRLNLT